MAFDFGQHPGLIVETRGGHRLVHAHDRNVSRLGRLANRRRQRVHDLLVVAEELDFVLGEETRLPA